MQIATTSRCVRQARRVTTVLRGSAAFAVFAALSGLPLQSPAGDAAQIEAGAELYAESCARCHGENREGLAAMTDDAETFVERLEGNTEEMPDFAGYFDEDEIAAMYAYLTAPPGE